MAPDAHLYSLRVFGCNGTTYLTVPAIDWAADPNGDGDFSDHLDVINMSLGSDYGSPYDADAVASDNAVLAGVIVVASAGNAANVYDIVGDPSVSGRAISVASSRDADNIVDGFLVDDGVLSGTVEPGSESAAFDWLTNTLPITGELVVPPDTSNDQALGCDPFNPTNAAAIAGKIVLLDWSEPSCGGSVTRTGNAYAAVAIGDHREVEGMALRLLDVVGPPVVRIDHVDRKPDRLDVALVPLGLQARHFAELGRADRREVLRVAEEQAPRIAQPLVEADRTLGALLFEVRRGLAEEDAHAEILLLVGRNGNRRNVAPLRP